MVRIKRGSSARNKHKKVLHQAKGYKGAHSKLFRTAKQQVMKGLRYSYSHRKKRKRVFRSKWIVQINAMAKQYDMTYHQFISNLKRSGIGLNRKILSQLANTDTVSFYLLTKI
jgi:large subunit ribosomal protein L20